MDGEAPMLNGTHRFPRMEQVDYGNPFAPAVAAEAERLGARAVFLMVGGTLSRETDVLTQLRDALGNRIAASAPAWVPIRHARTWSTPPTRPASPKRT